MRRLALLALFFASCLEPGLAPPEDAGVDAGPYKCSPLTCAGCCSNNICRGGNEFEACGYDGRACQFCRANTACVSPGTCVSVPRDGGSTRPFNPDAGGLTDPFTGGPLEPPTQKCIFIFGSFFCS